jgi:TniB protein
MDPSLSHLRPEIHALAALPATERLARLHVDHWIGHTRARAALAEMDGLFRHEPGRLRPRNLLVIGPSNNGKSTIAEKFRRTHPARTSDDGGREVLPVIVVQMPAEPTVSRLYTALLAALNTPVGLNGSLERKEGLALALLRACETRLLIIDELHNLLGAYPRRQRELLNGLRFLGNELKIPLVCLGTKDAYLAIRSDDQLENRFHPFLLPRWQDDEEFGRLLASFEATLPLREPSHLGSPQMRDLVLRRSEGTIGEVALLLTRAATAALAAGRERIDACALMTPDYQAPSMRRRSVERELAR